MGSGIGETIDVLLKIGFIKKCKGGFEGVGSLIFLKNIDNNSPESAIDSFKQAAQRADMFCILIKTKYSSDRIISAEGTLSEVDESTFKSIEDKENLKYFTFNVNQIEEDSYDSFTWLTQHENYFWAMDIENINLEYEFIYKFVIEYFKVNVDDYLWFDDADWYYNADDILKLSHMPYDPRWCSEKIV